MARLGPLSMEGWGVGGLGGWVRVLQPRMYESKDVEMKGLSQTLLVQKLLSGAGICTLNVFTLKYGRRRRPQHGPIDHMTPSVSAGRT